MKEATENIISVVAEVFGLDIATLCNGSRKRDVVEARRAAALLCRRYGIPARFLAERLGVSRWSVNRSQTDGLDDDGLLFNKRLETAYKHINSTYMAQ